LNIALWWVLGSWIVYGGLFSELRSKKRWVARGVPEDESGENGEWRGFTENELPTLGN
jgi:hypothetical protein